MKKQGQKNRKMEAAKKIEKTFAPKKRKWRKRKNHSS